jgi:hypothetical protein
MRAANDDTPSLPEDAAELRVLLLETLAQVETLAAERDLLANQNERLQHLLLKLKRRQFGTKSERLPEEQLLFAFEELEGGSWRPRCARRWHGTAGGRAARWRRRCRQTPRPIPQSRGWR